MLEVTLDGKILKIDKGTQLSTLFEDDKALSYHDNPVVAGVVNGTLMSLSERIECNAAVTPVRLFSNFGKRVYRKSLCFLLSYATSVVAPERILIIGHSLGDGFYFRYRDGKPGDVQKLKKVMEDAIVKDLPITLRDITHDEAVEYANKKGLKESEELLSTMNQPFYRFAEIGTCMEMYYEPMLPSLRLLELWELRQYEDGLLLRYPQSRNPHTIMPFTDHPLLFSVFNENKRYAKILGIQSIGELNEKVVSGEINKTILLSEALQRRRISDISRMIKDRGTVRAVFIAGPSSSGKTTFSIRLSDELRVDGIKPVRISLDDYYLPTEKIPLDENGERDYEVLESLDLPLLRSQLSDLINGKPVHLASFSFKTRKIMLREEETVLDDDSLLIIEGIHGLNPALIPDLPQEKGFRIYISALTQVNLDTRSRISTTDNRILRRMVRDNRTRGFNAVETLTRWPSVERGEKNHIFPFQNNADVMLNSALEYELGVLKPYAVPLLMSVPKKEGEAYANARRLLEFLGCIYPIAADAVPPDSLLREFIGGSIFSAT